ncbi:MAG: pyridoxal-phosphate dependent enzyme [Planctomycetes bacterium]|nr:pyridoxal-phosphate dependent enzyme [Planctomycetota bacterium]NOG52955.1 pyridoxal-phosphate dependent enzyme [Planctomycetota bacterium]
MDDAQYENLQHAIECCRQRNIVIPTFAQFVNPQGTVPDAIKNRLAAIGLNDLDPANLFRITWHNEPVEQGGQYGPVNFLEFPPELTGVEARIIGMVGRWFPTGAHKVGAAFGCLVPRLVTGRFDPTKHKAVWPSTGNYCRGGAFDSALLGCDAVAILPEQMSRERFEWLEHIGAEIIATPGCESNVKEIYDACHDIRRTRPECIVFNQFEEFGNSVWHYHVTGRAMHEAIRALGDPRLNPAAFVSATGSAGTIAAGDYLKHTFPNLRITAAEALQCPTLYQFGFGDHRIEGIGDKHVPWIHNVRNTDMVTAIDDEQCISLFRMFNEPAGRELLAQLVPERLISQLSLLGISSICNLISSIKTARYYGFGKHDCIVTSLTDSADMYRSRLAELNADRGPYTHEQAIADRSRWLEDITTDHMRELSMFDRQALHNFKYFTWVEQQGRSSDELNKLWDPDFWTQTYAQVDQWDELIAEFNRQTGVSTHT